MKTNREAVQTVLKKAEKLRKNKRRTAWILSASLTAATIFLVAFSGIITWRPTLYPNSYKRYLIPYATTETVEEKRSKNEAVCLTKNIEDGDMVETNENSSENGGNIPEAALRFIDKNNAVVSLGERAYPCRIRATSENTFTLDVTDEKTENESEGETSGNTDEETVIEEAPNAFRVEFWEDGANLSWSIGGITFKKILSVTEEHDIPTGLWVTHATAAVGDAPSPVSGGNWTLILEDGTSYVGEGTDTYFSKFFSVYNVLFQCIFDAKSGLLLDASLCTYDEKTFDFPTLKERYLSDAEEYYQWSKLVSDDEKISFTGATFQAMGATYESNDVTVSESDLPHKDMAVWRLFPYSSKPIALLNIGAALQLNEDGSAHLTVTGDRDYESESAGKWYPLHRLVLVVLDKPTLLTGRAFTLYTESATEETVPTQNELERNALSYLNRYDYYRVGYHAFEYHVLEETVKIFWGRAWEKDHLLPKLHYEKTYVLNGQYLPASFSGNPNAGTALEAIADNGNITLVFHENGTATVTHLDTQNSVTVRFANEHDHTYRFESPIYIRLNGEVTTKLTALNVKGGYLVYEYEEYDQTSGYRTYLIYRFDLII